jgi:hypothetical protein
MNFDAPPIVSIVTPCQNCRRSLTLEIERPIGPAAYDTYNEFWCPHCRKLNRERTPGRILSVAAVEGTAA